MAVQRHPPPGRTGRRDQAQVHGPDWQGPARRPSCCSPAAPTACRTSYRRYLINSLRESFDLPGVPIRITIKATPQPYAEEARRACRSVAPVPTARPSACKKKIAARKKATVAEITLRRAPAVPAKAKPVSRSLSGCGAGKAWAAEDRSQAVEVKAAQGKAMAKRAGQRTPDHAQAAQASWRRRRRAVSAASKRGLGARMLCGVPLETCTNRIHAGRRLLVGAAQVDDQGHDGPGGGRPAGSSPGKAAALHAGAHGAGVEQDGAQGVIAVSSRLGSRPWLSSPGLGGRRRRPRRPWGCCAALLVRKMARPAALWRSRGVQRADQPVVGGQVHRHRPGPTSAAPGGHGRQQPQALRPREIEDVELAPALVDLRRPADGWPSAAAQVQGARGWRLRRSPS